MSVRQDTPCNYGECPYSAEYWNSCEYWCGADEPQDDPDIWEDENLGEKGEKMKTKLIVRGRVNHRDDNFITVLDLERNAMFTICRSGMDWGCRKVGTRFPDGFLFTQELFDKWYAESPETEHTFVLEA